MMSGRSRESVRATVVIPTYNRTPFLRDTIYSLLGQKEAPNYEIVVVDNEPSMELREFLHSCNQVQDGQQIRYVAEPRSGLHYARHAGAREARGEIIVYVDDDVLVPCMWLKEMLRPYNDPTVAAVGGRTVPMFPEGKEPQFWWLSVTCAHLSILDLGDEARFMIPPETPYGCNMSVRRTVLKKIRGFHPDGFADKNLLSYRGDGEAGLAKKLYKEGFGIWYSSSAWLYHQVPESRMSLEYLRKRSCNQGISNVFSYYREKPGGTTALLLNILPMMARYVGSRVWYCLSTQPDQKLLRLLASVSYESRIRQTLRLVFDKDLREFILQEDFLEGSPLE